ncbi:hypothetical protein [Sphingomonas sp. MA1305]|uniref:hypothetical protein n=1 Tax=Sphingomonas sp. MA1305 TaxID=2479204 RepID=UPI0018DF305B|nr:hypothetical protein [Sphingomonas sp. MA1305]
MVRTGAIGLHRDDGSRSVTPEDFVVDAGIRPSAVTMDHYRPSRTTTDNLATGNL